MRVQPKRVRYIKLGEAGRWENECIESGIIRFGFGSAKGERFPLCLGARWEALMQSFISEGKSKGSATRFTNETRIFFEDDGSTLWITFVGEQLYWGFLASDPPERHLDGDGVYRTLVDGWLKTDTSGKPLTKDRLAGGLTKVAAYRGTSCDVDDPDYIIRRINGLMTPEVDRALAAQQKMTDSVLELMRLLGWRDFETLVDLVFTSSGWRRLGVVGKTQETLDLDLTLPSTDERAMVQIKSATTSAELAECVSEFEGHGLHSRMFYVFHSGEAETDNERVVIIGPEKLAGLVMEAGLASWLIRKVS